MSSSKLSADRRIDYVLVREVEGLCRICNLWHRVAFDENDLPVLTFHLMKEIGSINAPLMRCSGIETLPVRCREHILYRVVDLDAPLPENIVIEQPEQPEKRSFLRRLLPV